MIPKKSTSAYICILTISILLLLATKASAQKHYVETEKKDSVALLQSVEASIDGVGPMMKVFGDYGHVEGALRVNLKGKYFPIVEIGNCCGFEDHSSFTRTFTQNVGMSPSDYRLTRGQG